MGEFLKRMLKIFRSEPDMTKMGFLSSFFTTGPEDIVDSEYVSIDIVRTDEDVAPVLRDYKTGAVAIAEDIYTNKQIKPPIYSLERPVNIFELMKRQPGETEYAKVGTWFARLVKVLAPAFVKMTNMIKRSIEVQAAQVLQTGKLDLPDENGVVAYQLDYRPKATHFPSVTIPWSDPSAKPLDDLEAFADVIRDNGLRDPENAIFSATSWRDFISHESVKDVLKKDSIGLGVLSPRMVNNGGKYQGYINIGSYRINLFTYNGRYINFGDTVKNKFIMDNNVIMTASMEDLDFRLVYGGIPSIGMDDPFNDIVPERVSVDEVYDFRPRVYKDQRADVFFGEVKSRPICIPVSIDRFGCLKTVAD